MKESMLALGLAILAAGNAAADSKLYEFRGNYRGMVVLATGADSLRGASTAKFQAQKDKGRGVFAVNSTFYSGTDAIPLPNTLKFHGNSVSFSLGEGATAASGTGRLAKRNSALTYSISVNFLGGPAVVTGRLERTSRGLEVSQTINAQGSTQTLTYNLKSKQWLESHPGNGSGSGSGGAAGDPSGAASGQNDAASLAERLTGSGGTVGITAVYPNAYEKEGTFAVLRISRAGNDRALPVYFSLGGNSDPQKGSASPADYQLQDGAGNAVGNRILIPAGAASVDLRVLPVADTLHEVPETLTVTLRPDATYELGASTTAAVAISDATRSPLNDHILIAYLSPAAGATTSASGISTVHLSGDNTDALVDVSFSGLTSPQSAAHINAPNTSSGAGADIKGLPRGQVAGSLWTIAAAQFLTTDQAVLDALYSGQLSLSVLSGDYPDGEIRGNYVLNSAPTDPDAPPDPPSETTLTGEALRRDVARFLMQATFGPTPAEIDALAADIEQNRGGDSISGYSAWIDAQFALEQTRLLDLVQAADAQEWARRGTDPINYVSGNEPGSTNRRRSWWPLAIKAGDELRQRVAFALSEIFVASEYDEELQIRHYGLANYYDLLGRYADGNYRGLLGEISRSPIMGKYLSSLKNQKAVVQAGTGKILVSPDENYAREVMQLFSIGLVQLNTDGSVKLGSSGSPIPTYTNADITEMARVFTGWSFSKANGSKASGYSVVDNTNFNAGSGPQYFQAAWLNPMKNFATYHDTGAKAVLGATIPAGLTGDQDMDAALDILANHANTAPFISRLLIQRLVTSNPTNGYVYRVAKVFADDGAGQRGNLKAVVKAILLDHEARNAAASLAVSHGKQKEPIIRYAQLLRAFGAASQLPLSDFTSYGYPTSQLDHFPAGATSYRYANTDTPLAQTPQRSPTVFNWYLPGYSPPGAIAAASLVAPEMQLTTETQVTQTVNYLRVFSESDTGQSVDALVNATAAEKLLDDVKIDRSSLVNQYKGLIAGGATVKDAVTAVLDNIDLLLTGGRLKERYETAALPNPRSIIIDAVVATSEGATSNDRVKALCYLVESSPTYIHQP